MRLVVKVLGKVRNYIDELIKGFQRQSDPQFCVLEKWYREDKHGLKRSSFDNIDDSSIVFDLGGYEGQWSSDVYARYNCNIFVFEPVSAYFKVIDTRFEKNDKVKPFLFGLAERSYNAEISVDEFASSIHNNSSRKSETKEVIEIRDYQEVFTDYSLIVIDLMKINIEGGEYDLLESMLANGNITMVKQLLIQFHNFVPNATARMHKIKADLSKTHKPLYTYEFIWEHWILNK